MNAHDHDRLKQLETTVEINFEDSFKIRNVVKTK